MSFIIDTLRNEIKNNMIDNNYLSLIFKIYNELTSAKEIPLITLKNIVNSLPGNHEIYVCKCDNKPVGLITLIIESKLIHSGGRVGHIEDLAVDKEYRNMYIGKALINHCIVKSRSIGCYKVILNCNDKLKDYYIKNNFVNTGNYMTYKIY